MRRDRAAGVSLLGLLGALLVWNLIFVGTHCDELRPTSPGERAPELQIANVDGGPDATLAGLAGKVVLVDFWATWCLPCRHTLPFLEGLYERHRSQGFTILSVNVEGPNRKKAARAFADGFQPRLTFPIYVDDAYQTAEDRYRVEGIPHMVLVDKRGRVAQIHVGEMDAAEEADLEGLIERLLRE